MDEAFRKHLKRGGRSDSAIRRILQYVAQFEGFMAEQRGKAAAQAVEQDIEAFTERIESGPKASAKGQLWALRYYFQFAGKESLAKVASSLRQQRIDRSPFPLRQFQGVHPEHLEPLAEAGIHNVAQMLEAGGSVAGRQKLAADTGVPLEAILELVKLSDLARLPGVKRIRARLYHDAGVDSIEKMAAWEPEALRQAMIVFVERTGFDGMAPLPAEAQSAVSHARKLPKIVEYQELP